MQHQVDSSFPSTLKRRNASRNKNKRHTTQPVQASQIPTASAGEGSKKVEVRGPGLRKTLRSLSTPSLLPKEMKLAIFDDVNENEEAKAKDEVEREESQKV
jgi:hypothetical protein